MRLFSVIVAMLLIVAVAGAQLPSDIVTANKGHAPATIDLMWTNPAAAKQIAAQNAPLMPYDQSMGSSFGLKFPSLGHYTFGVEHITQSANDSYLPRYLTNFTKDLGELPLSIDMNPQNNGIEPWSLDNTSPLSVNPYSLVYL